MLLLTCGSFTASIPLSDWSVCSDWEAAWRGRRRLCKRARYGTLVLAATRSRLKAVASGHFETVQFPLNFVSDEAADELLPLAQEHDMGFIAMKPFAGGRIQKANLAIKYLLQFENVVPDPGIEKVEEIEEIVGIVNSGDWELTDQERQEVGEIRARVGTRFCRQCEYCMPYTGCAYLWCAVSQDFVGTVAARNVFLWTVYWGICGSRCRECRGLHRVWRV